MAGKDLKVTKETGVTAYEIAGYILEENKLNFVIEQCRCKIEEWIVKENNYDYRFANGRTIKIPDLEEIKKTNDNFQALCSGASGTSCQCGWRLTTNGKLVRGETGWLTDENGLYILKDGRRLNGEHKECTEDLRIGSDDIWGGLEKILGNLNEIKKTESIFNTRELFRKYGPHMTELVVYQAFQINLGYKLLKEKGTVITNSSAWEHCTRYNPAYRGAVLENIETPSDCSFGVIGTDETDIPIIVTRIGKDGAKNKIVIAGPHGNERNARFVVLEIQKYFIENGVSTSDLVLYFIPAMSPTMFFADARGLPLDRNGEYLRNKYPIEDVVRMKAVEKINALTITKLHDDIASKIPNGNIWQDAIQDQNDPTKPEYGIDTNRDFYNALPSTQSCLQFFKNNKENMTVFMLHGYEPLKKGRVRDGEHINEYQCTLAGPYKLKGNSGYIDEDIMDLMDVITSLLFGYRYKREGNNSNNYFFDGKTDVGTKYNGEWLRKLYLDTSSLKIMCFDIEMGENYREGSRNKTGSSTAGRDRKYEYIRVTDRLNQPNMPFFNQSIKRKFNNVNKTVLFSDEGETNSVMLSFTDFLNEYHVHWKKVVEEIK